MLINRLNDSPRGFHFGASDDRPESVVEEQPCDPLGSERQGDNNSDSRLCGIAHDCALGKHFRL